VRLAVNLAVIGAFVWFCASVCVGAFAIHADLGWVATSFSVLFASSIAHKAVNS